MIQDNMELLHILLFDKSMIEKGLQCIIHFYIYKKKTRCFVFMKPTVYIALYWAIFFSTLNTIRGFGNFFLFITEQDRIANTK